MNKKAFTCFIIGEDSLLIRCSELLLEGGHEIYGIVSENSVISNWVRDKNIKLIQPEADLFHELQQKPFDYLFSIVNLKILGNEILNLPRKFAINFHDGPLPKYAGLNAPSWAIMNQETQYGITWHLMSAEVDKGDIVKKVTFEIAKDENVVSLNAKCFEAAIDGFTELIHELAEGKIQFQKQNINERTYFSKTQRPANACTIDWDCTAEQIYAKCRALDFGNYANPFGLPKIILRNEFFIVKNLEILDRISTTKPGTITSLNDRSIYISTKSHDIAIYIVTTIDGQDVTLAELIRKFNLKVGDAFSVLKADDEKRLSSLNNEICKNEVFWKKQLRDIEFAQVPYAKAQKSKLNPEQYITHPLQIERDKVQDFKTSTSLDENVDDLIIAIFCLFIGRLLDKNTFHLGYSHVFLNEELFCFENLFATYLPLRIQIEDDSRFQTAFAVVLNQLKVVRKNRTYIRDLIVRHPQLGDLVKRGGQPHYPILVGKAERLTNIKLQKRSILTFVMIENFDECYWIFNPEVIALDDIKRIQSYFLNFVGSIFNRKEQPLTSIPLLSAAERHKLLYEWNNTKLIYSKDKCIHELIEAQAKKTPNAIAVFYNGKELTYAQLNYWANQLARELQKLEIGPESLVGVYMHRSPEMLVAILGILKAGGAYVPLDPNFPKERLTFMLEDAGCRVVITDDNLRNLFLPKNAKVVGLESDDEDITNDNLKNIKSSVKSKNLSYVIYTSGSTGKPKGVMVQHQNVLNFFTGMDKQIQYEPPGVWLAVTSLSFDISVLELLWTLTHGFKIVLYAEEKLKISDIKSTIQAIACANTVITIADICIKKNSKTNDYSIPTLIENHKVTHMQCTPSMARMLTMDELTSKALKRLLYFMVGGESFPLPLAKHLTKMIDGLVINMYGPTETTIWSTTHLVNGVNETVPIGRPIANTEIYILDSNHQLVPIGFPGELCIGGDSVARGYYNRPELTAEKFIPNPFKANDHGRIYRTGDLARYLPDGSLEYIGRLDHQVKIRGHRIELGEIEFVLEQYAGVCKALVMVYNDIPDDKRLVAFIEANQETQLKVETIRRFLLNRLPKYMVPSSFKVVKSLPLTPNGKINRNALPAPKIEQPEVQRSFTVPRSLSEISLAKMWTDVLGINNICLNDNFFDLGGNSLSAVQIAVRIRQQYNVEFPLQILFQASTLGILTERLEEKLLEKAREQNLEHLLLRKEQLSG